MRKRALIMSEVDTRAWAGQAIGEVGGLDLVWPSDAGRYPDLIHVLSGYGIAPWHSLSGLAQQIGGPNWSIELDAATGHLLVGSAGAFEIHPSPGWGFPQLIAATFQPERSRWEILAPLPHRGVIREPLILGPVGSPFSVPPYAGWFQGAAIALRVRGVPQDEDDLYPSACLEALEPWAEIYFERVAWVLDEAGHVVRVWDANSITEHFAFKDNEPGRAAAAALGFSSLSPPVQSEGGIRYQRSECPSPHALVTGYPLRLWRRGLRQISTGSTSLAGLVGALELGQYTEWRAQIYSRGPAQGAGDELHLLRSGGFFSRAGHGATITVCPNMGDLRRAADTPGHSLLWNPDGLGRAGRRVCQRSPEDEGLRLCDYTEQEIEYRALHELVLVEAH